MRCGFLGVCLAVVLVAASPCIGGINECAKVAVHVWPHHAGRTCDSLPPFTCCVDFNFTYEGYEFDAFPVFFDLTEYRGVEYGVAWPVSFGRALFTSCSDLTIGGIEYPGDGVSHAWFECQTSYVAVPGYLWLTADEAGYVRVVSHPVGSAGPGIYVLNCSDGLSEPLFNFRAGVCGAIGEDPCMPTDPDATEPGTWGGVKSLFAD